MTRAALVLCRVVDNFGDAGVCWRFARQLAREHGWQVRLLIDRPETLTLLGADPRADAGRGSIAVARWTTAAATGSASASTSALRSASPSVSPPDEIDDDDVDVVVSAFGAEPPAQVRARLAGAPRRPLWVHLEYLSAEPWVSTHHGLSSIKPGDAAVEHFYYPGYDASTGGLLRERDLYARRDAFVGSARQRDWLARWGFGADVDGERTATLFCYPPAPLASWFAALAAGPIRWRVLVPEGVADAALRAHFAASPAVGQRLHDGNLVVQRIPFLAQDDYDRLLWSADLNFVRGEDSWLRAQWAARPFIWQPYRQEDGLHLVKLRAFLQRLQAPAEVDAAMRAWSGDGDWRAAWPAFEARLATLSEPFANWARTLAAQEDLCTRFVEFCRHRL